MLWTVVRYGTITSHKYTVTVDGLVVGRGGTFHVMELDADGACRLGAVVAEPRRTSETMVPD